MNLSKWLVAVMLILCMTVTGRAHTSEATTILHAQAQVTNQAVTSSSVIVAAVLAPGSANPQSPLSLEMRGTKRELFSLTNFGTWNVSRITLSQSLAGVTLRYCVNQDFQKNSSTTCTDGTAGIIATTSTSATVVNFAQPLLSAQSRAFSATITGNGPAVTNVISVSVSTQMMTSQVRTN